MPTANELTLYEEFVEARRTAIELTDHYEEANVTDPHRPELWTHAMRQTETARLLLEEWLTVGASPSDWESSPSKRELVLV
jgi:hypothetical protein